MLNDISVKIPPLYTTYAYNIHSQFKKYQNIYHHCAKDKKSQWLHCYQFTLERSTVFYCFSSVMRWNLYLSPEFHFHFYNCPLVLPIWVSYRSFSKTTRSKIKVSILPFISDPLKEWNHDSLTSKLEVGCIPNTPFSYFTHGNNSQQVLQLPHPQLPHFSKPYWQFFSSLL